MAAAYAKVAPHPERFDEPPARSMTSLNGWSGRSPVPNELVRDMCRRGRENASVRSGRAKYGVQ